ncbi:MAG: tetratricopeptide repeat protein [Erysipelotrichia bacterium]|nr:tetratricopeptide repeat protein [Erysipelotrichia bacterium]
MKVFFFRLVFIVLLAVSLSLATGCCRKKVGDQSDFGVSRRSSSAASSSQKKSGGQQAVEQPVDLLAKTGLNYSIDSGDATRKAAKKNGGSFFEKQYLQGVDMMEKGEFSKAIELFDELVKRYPNTEEASVAELCIAELYFRSKSNDRALQAYKRIVETYPNSHAAENARAGIEYLQNFEKYEQEYVSPDVEARKRRGY